MAQAKPSPDSDWEEIPLEGPSGTRVPSPAELRAFTVEEAQRQGVDPGHVLPLFKQESSFRADALGPVTRSGERAVGPAQLMPGTARGLGVNPADPYDNIRGGIAYYKQQLERFKDPTLARAAYNAGPGAVQKYGGVPPFAETQDYVRKTTPQRTPASDEWEEIPPDAPALSPTSVGFGAVGVPKRIQKIYSPEERSIDYRQGVPNASLRAKLSIANTDEEKLDVLEGAAGAGQVGINKEGRYFIRPAGLKKLGIESDRPRIVDEPSLTRYDIADIAGDIPAIAGGLVGSVATSGMGLIPAVAGAALGGGAGSAMKEIVRVQTGVGPFQAGQVAQEAALSAFGEMGGRAIGAVGRKLMGPGRASMTPARTQAMESALARGYLPTPDEIRGGGVMSRMTGVVRQMFGAPGQAENVDAALRELGGLIHSAGKRVPAEAVGERAVDALKQARVQFGSLSSAKFNEIGDIAVAPDALKRQAREILDTLVKTKADKPVFASPETVGFLERIASLPDTMSVGQMQQVRTQLREASSLQTLAPDLAKRHAKMLLKAADDVFSDAAHLTQVSRTSEILDQTGKPLVTATRLDPVRQSDAVEKLRNADKFYKEGIKQFDTAVIDRLVRDASRGGHVDPDQFLDFVIRPEHAVRARQVLSMLPKARVDEVRGALAGKLLQPLVQDAANPFEKVLRGDFLKAELDRYGPDVLKTVMGGEWTRAAYNLADTVKLVTAGNKSAGGLVVAHTMMQAVTNPTQAVPKIAAYRLLYKALRNPAFIRYMTTGIQAPTAEKAAGFINRALMQTGMQTSEAGGGELEFINRLGLVVPDDAGAQGGP